MTPQHGHQVRSGPARARPRGGRDRTDARRARARDPRAHLRAEVRSRPVTLRPGVKLTLTFRAMAPDGAAVAVAGDQRIAVPFAIPGEEAVVEIVRGGAHPEGRISTLLRKSPQTLEPRCRHFGVCGGCQWQHLDYAAQLEHKTHLVREALREVIQNAGAALHPASGSVPWEYRSRLQAVFGVRGDRVVAGYHAAAADLRIINVQECPIQQGGNVGALAAVRDVIAGLDWPIYDHHTGRGVIRGVIVQTAAASGETMVVLAATRDLPDRMAFVRAVRDRLPGLVSLILSVQPRRTPELLGRLELLWGRAYVEEEIDGLRLHLTPRSAVPPNPRALPSYLAAIASALAVTPDDVVVDAACEDGLLPLWLARQVRRVIGVAPDRAAMHRAWDHARLNGVTNCVFYTRAPAGVVAKLRARGERVDAAVIPSRGRAAGVELFRGLAAAGVRRLAVAGSSLALLAADTRAAGDAGYRARTVQPVDLLPQTSKVHGVVGLEHSAAGTESTRTESTRTESAGTWKTGRESTGRENTAR